MSLSKPGKSISEVEVSDISAHGIWMLIGEEEFFLSHEDFPWFKQAPVAAVFNVQRESTEHFRWPDLDVDLCLESIRHPERFPLKYKA
jgi:Protein of unknown function (DUF2442)